MGNDELVVKLTEVRGRCSYCGFERTLYFWYGNYGERIVSTKDGSACAVADLMKDNIVQELAQYCAEILPQRQSDVAQNVLSRIVADIYGITCDDIEGKKAETLSVTRCPNCLRWEIEEDESFGERPKEIKVGYVTHHAWEKLDEKSKKLKITKELSRQGYI